MLYIIYRYTKTHLYVSVALRYSVFSNRNRKYQKIDRQGK